MDEQLKEAFAQLRAHERAQAPEFATLIANAPRSRVRHTGKFAIAAVAAAIAAMVLWPRHIDDTVTTLSITEWRAPTDVLLDTPGNDLVTQLPALNESVLDMGGTP